MMKKAIFPGQHLPGPGALAAVRDFLKRTEQE